MRLDNHETQRPRQGWAVAGRRAEGVREGVMSAPFGKDGGVMGLASSGISVDIIEK